MSEQMVRALIIAHGRKQPGFVHQANTGINNNYKALNLDMHASVVFCDVCSLPAE